MLVVEPVHAAEIRDTARRGHPGPAKEDHAVMGVEKPLQRPLSGSRIRYRSSHSNRTVLP